MERPRVLERPGQRAFRCHVPMLPQDWSGCGGGSRVTDRFDAAPVHQRDFGRSHSDRLHGEARRPDLPTPADWAGRGPVEAVPLPEDEAAAQTLGRVHVQPLSRPSERAGHVGEVAGDLLLRDPDEARELVGGVWALAEVAKERFANRDRALCRWALGSWRSHPARILRLGPIGLRTIGTANVLKR
jgi:hypothetical protein